MKPNGPVIWFAAAVAHSSHGGVARTVHELSARLETRGYGVRRVFAGDARMRGGYLLFAVTLALRLLVSENRPDFLIARSSDGVFCALLARVLRLRTRVIIHNHGWEEKVCDLEARLPAGVVTNPTTWRARLLRLPLLRCALRWSDGCLCGTIDETRYLKNKYPYAACKIWYQPNGVDVAPVNNRTDFPARFLMVGGATWKKNIEHGLRVFARVREICPGATLCWVGAGGDHRRIAASCGVAPDGIVAVADESFAGMSRWYRECSFLLLPSRFEGGHPMTVLEGMSFGMVVFVSAIRSCGEIVADGVNGFVLPGIDAADDARRVSGCLGARDDLARISRRAVTSASRHRWERQVDRLERALEKVDR